MAFGILGRLPGAQGTAGRTSPLSGSTEETSDPEGWMAASVGRGRSNAACLAKRMSVCHLYASEALAPRCQKGSQALPLRSSAKNPARVCRPLVSAGRSSAKHSAQPAAADGRTEGWLVRQEPGAALAGRFRLRPLGVPSHRFTPGTWRTEELDFADCRRSIPLRYVPSPKTPPQLHSSHAAPAIHEDKPGTPAAVSVANSAPATLLMLARLGLHGIRHPHGRPQS